jgi:exodeoxyribonuclease VII small subunit
MGKKKEKSFEQSMDRLQEISEALEKSELGLDESIKLFEEGISLSKTCYTKLKNAELRITELKNQFQSELGEDD